MIVSPFYREETESWGGFGDWLKATQQVRNAAGSKFRSASSEGLLLSFGHSALPLDYVFFRAECLITDRKKERLRKAEPLRTS